MYQEIIDLVAFRDLSYEEASQTLGGTSLGTLRSRMYHALRRLRSELAAIGGNDGSRLLNDDECSRPSISRSVVEEGP